MKWLSVLPLLNYLSPLLAFQPSVVSPVRTQMANIVAMNFFPDNFARAEYCATHSGACSLEELEELAEELNRFQHSDDGELQGRDDYEDTKKVYKILHTQKDIKHMMDDYVKCHHQETFDMSDV
ncbi:hypothetical protein ACHAXH_002379 [Discostella pseudostelligera]